MDLWAPVEHPRAAEVLLQVGLGLAEEEGLVLFDPQLGVALTRAHAEQVAAKIRLMGDYLLQVPGPGPGSAGAAGLSRSWAVLLGGLALVLLTGLLWRCPA